MTAKIFGVAFSVLAYVTFVSGACSKGKDKKAEAESSGTSNLNLSLKSSKVTALTLLAATEGCSCGTPGTGNGGPLCDGGGDGKCYSPTAFKGYFNLMNISSISGGYARLLGGGNKYHGLEAVFRTAYFDVTKSVFFDGDDNIQDNTTTSAFTMGNIDMQAVDYQFSAVGKYFNIRVPAITFPVVSDPKFVGCIDEGGLSESVKYVKLYSTTQTISAGDILVCLKTTKTAACTDAEYLWIDKSTGAISPTRPSTPVRFSGSAFGNPSSCKAGADHPEVNWGSVSFLIGMDATPVSVTAAFSGGKKTYTSGGVSGNTMDVTIDLDASNQIFVPQSLVTAFTTTTENSSYETEILKNLSVLTLRGLYDHNTRASTSTNIDKADWLVGKITLAISDKTEEEDGDVEDLSTTIPK
jgi:hypothetical protein